MNSFFFGKSYHHDSHDSLNVSAPSGLRPQESELVRNWLYLDIIIIYQSKTRSWGLTYQGLLLNNKMSLFKYSPL